MTCHSESVTNNVVSYTSAQEQVRLVKPMTQFSRRLSLWSKCSLGVFLPAKSFSNETLHDSLVKYSS